MVYHTGPIRDSTFGGILPTTAWRWADFASSHGRFVQKVGVEPHFPRGSQIPSSPRTKNQSFSAACSDCDGMPFQESSMWQQWPIQKRTIGLWAQNGAPSHISKSARPVPLTRARVLRRKSRCVSSCCRPNRTIPQGVAPIRFRC